MPSARNSTEPLPQTASNTALFQMMLHYKTEAEATHTTVGVLNNLLAANQHEIHELHATVQEYAVANRRGARLITDKHQAGVMLLECMDRMAALLGTMRREIPQVGAFVPEIERILLRGDFAAHMLHGVNMVDLEADEVIDLTGEDTEPEDMEV